MRDGVRVRELDNDLDNDAVNRLLRIVRRSSGSVVTWRRAQMVLLSAQAWTWRGSLRCRAPRSIESARCSTTSTTTVRLAVSEVRRWAATDVSRCLRAERSRGLA